MNEAIDYFNADEIREAEEIQRELDERDRADAEWAHQQSLDEQADALTVEEQQEYILWNLECVMRYALQECGGEPVEELYYRVMNTCGPLKDDDRNHL